MGMYTELVLKCGIMDGLPVDAEAVLQFLFNGGPEITAVPDHPFFKCDRWSCIGRTSSYYHHPRALSSYVGGYLFSRSDLKNYDGEIEEFISWVTPYLAHYEGDCIGWKWYEEDNAPELIFFQDCGGE